MEDHDKVLSQGPWAIKGITLNLHKWLSAFTLTEINFNLCEFWINVHDLPPNCLNADNARIVWNYIGKFISIDESQPIYKVRKFLRIMVLVDTQQALKTGIFISRENGAKLWVFFKYERLHLWTHWSHTSDESISISRRNGKQLWTLVKSFKPWKQENESEPQ